MATTINLGKVVPQKGVDYFTDAEIAQFKQEISNDLQSQITALKSVTGTTTDTFSTTSTYTVGDIVIKDNKYYRCITAVTTAGAWTAANWEELTIREEQNEQNDEIGTLGSRVKVLEENTRIQDLTWEEIENIVKHDQVLQYFNIGDELTEDWTDKATSGTDTAYEAVPMYIVHNGNVELQNGDAYKGMFMEWKYTLPFATNFCEGQALQCFDGTEGTPNGLPAGNYCFHVTSLPNWDKARAVYADKYLSFELTQAIPAGGILKGIDWGNSESGWKIRSMSSHLANASTIETITLAINDSQPSGYTNLGDTWGTDVGYGKLNWTECVAYGDNTWRDSDLRQYLNSSEDDWWTKKTRYNIQPAYATTHKGFLAGYSQDFINSLKTIKVGSYTNNVKENEGLVYTYDKIFLHSPAQRNCTTGNSDQDNLNTMNEGEPWAYYKALAQGQENLDSRGRFKNGSTYPILIRYGLNAQSTGRTIFARSARRARGYSVYVVYTSGHVNSYGTAGNGGYCVPACII